MSEPEPAAHARESLPRHTTPTWEMELLISGATVFALLQLPGALDSMLMALAPRFERVGATLLLLPMLYVKSAAYVLILTFVLHLATRGYWVAMVGLRSVYPDGIDWARLRWGPTYLATVRERMRSTDALVELADNRASQVFGFGIGFALVMLAPLLIVVTTSVIAYGLHELLDRRIAWLTLWHALLAVLFLPYLAGFMLDRLLAKRTLPDGRIARALRRMFALYFRLGFSSFSNYPLLMFMSRTGSRRGGIAMTIMVSLLVGLSLAQILWSDLGDSVGNYRHLPATGVGQARSLWPDHYADQRRDGAGLDPPVFIDSAIARDDYVRLFIPFRPSRDNPAIERECPPAGTTAIDASTDPLLDCLARLYPIALDEVTLADPRFDHAQDPASGLRGVVAMIRVADLAPGRHELEVSRPTREPPRAGDQPERPARIPFWR